MVRYLFCFPFQSVCLWKNCVISGGYKIWLIKKQVCFVSPWHLNTINSLQVIYLRFCRTCSFVIYICTCTQILYIYIYIKWNLDAFSRTLSREYKMIVVACARWFKLWCIRHESEGWWIQKRQHHSWVQDEYRYLYTVDILNANFTIYMACISDESTRVILYVL